MTNTGSSTARLGLVLLMSGVLAGQPVWADKKADLESVRERLDKLQQEYRETRESRNEAADALKQSEQAISQTVAQLHKLEAQQRTTQEELRNVASEADQTQSNIQKRQARLSEMLKQSYMRGGGDALKLILNGQNPSQSARDLHYLSYLTREQARLIDALRGDLAHLRGLKKTAEEKNRDLQDIRKTQLQQRAGLLKERKDRQQVLDRLSAQIRSQRKEISTLKRNEQRLTDLLARLAKRSKPSRKETLRKQDSAGKPVAVIDEVPEFRAEGTPFSRLKGSMRLPVRGELMNTFGAPREGGALNWKGLFIRAPEGAEVRSIAQGTVVFSDWLRGFGNLLIVDQGEGYLSLYSNNESLYKQKGDKVKAGEVIASVGNSGGQEETGLYFELRYQSKPINPMSWVK